MTTLGVTIIWIGGIFLGYGIRVLIEKRKTKRIPELKTIDISHNHDLSGELYLGGVELAEKVEINIVGTNITSIRLPKGSVTEERIINLIKTKK